MNDDIHCFIERGALGADLTAIDFVRRVDGGVKYAIRTGGLPHDRGRIGWREQGDDQVHEHLLLLNHWEVQAFWKAVEGRYDPPTESKALREALAVERARVERMIDAHLPRSL